MKSQQIMRTVMAVALLLSGIACTTVGPDYHVPPQSVAKRQAAAGQFAGSGEAPFQISPLPPQWWRLYRDAILDRLIVKAFAANTDLRIASANLARARRPN